NCHHISFTSYKVFILREVFLMTMTKSMTKNNELTSLIKKITKDLSVDVVSYKEKVMRTISDATIDDYAYDVLIKSALENIDESDPDWTYVASRAYLQQLYEKAAQNRGYIANLKYGDLYTLLKT